MRFVTSALLLIVTALGVTSCQTQPRAVTPDQTVILIGIDGFRWDYLERHHAPTLQQLARDGTRVTRMQPSFPSKTFPNHYTLVTGLRPESHGIVANGFYDPATGESFTMVKHETHWWQGGEPVWITAEKQGVRSACFFWPGSEAELQGRRPSFYRPFDKKVTCNERVDGLLAWLDLPAVERPRFLTLYFDVVDTQGHKYGPLATETSAAVSEVDAAVARLLAGLEQRGLRARTNLVVVADHGMMEISTDRVVFIEDLVDPRQVRVESLGPNGGVRPLPGSGLTPQQLAVSIRAKAPPQIQVYLREKVPARLHYRHNDRIPPVVLVADAHWNIESKVGWARWSKNYNRASHGWDPAHEQMGAVFIAQGPAIQTGRTVEQTENIHVYNLLCTLLGVQPAKNEGNFSLTRAVLR